MLGYNVHFFHKPSDEREKDFTIFIVSPFPIGVGTTICIRNKVTTEEKGSKAAPGWIDHQMDWQVDEVFYSTDSKLQISPTGNIWVSP